MRINPIFAFLTPLWIFTQFADSKRVMILDTIEQSQTAGELNWAKYSKGRKHDEDAGWLEETYLDKTQNNANYRAYVVCEVSNRGVDNWLRTPFIPRNDANRIYLDVTFTMRDCKLWPREARSCKETFTMYYFEADSDMANKDFPAWSETSWKQIDRITSDTGRFTAAGQEQKSTETRSVQATKKGVYFAFRDEGACTSILYTKIYYEECPEVIQSLAWFPKTPAGKDQMALVSRMGTCVEHSTPINGDLPRYLCKADGSWDQPSGSCQCDAGYYPENGYNSKTCKPCKKGAYKWSVGPETCEKCPKNSHTDEESSTYCECDIGYYRPNKTDSVSAPCTRPPSRPMNARVLSVDQNSAIITWDVPLDNGGRKDLWYRAECDLCPAGTQFSPAQHRISGNELTLNGLNPGQSYSVLVFAENDVSALLPGLPMYTVAEIETSAGSGGLSVQNLRVDSVSDTLISLSWTPPADVRDAYAADTNLVQYEVRYYPTRVPSNMQTQKTADTQISINGLQPNSQYRFQVRLFTPTEWGEWSESMVERTVNYPGQYSADGAADPAVGTGTIAAIVIAVFLLVVVVVICFVYCGRKNRPVGKKQNSDLDSLDYKHGNLTPSDYNQVFGNTMPHKLSTPLMPGLQGGLLGFKPYVDPLAYEDPSLALREFANEVDPSQVIIEEIIGSGEFGEVCKGRLCFRGKRDELVAIKTLRSDATAKVKGDFLPEASIMGQFDHPNVIKLRGVVSRSEPVMIIIEYMANRSLDTFLKKHDGRLELLQLVAMLRGIASGMKYLSDKQYVHRDLAARNVLVDDHLTCKIADFGLSRGLKDNEEQVYTTKGGKIPVRWTSPEAIQYRKFTSASDVWSYGVVMWEVMSYGERPYWDWTNQDVIQAIDRGWRLPPPMDCPQILHEMMLECWQAERCRRPSFTRLLHTLDNFLKTPDLLYTNTSTSTLSTPVQSCTSMSSDYSPGPVTLSLEDFLRGIELAHLLPTLYSRGVSSLAALQRLTALDMCTYGLTLAEQNQIKDAMQRLSYGMPMGGNSAPALPNLSTGSMPRRTVLQHHNSRVQLAGQHSSGTVGRKRDNNHNRDNGFFV